MKLKIGENRKKAKVIGKTSLCNLFGVLLVMSFISATLGYYWAIISSQIVRNLYLPWDFVSGLDHMHLTIVPVAFQQTSTSRVAVLCEFGFVHLSLYILNRRLTPCVAQYPMCYVRTWQWVVLGGWLIETKFGRILISTTR